MEPRLPLELGRDWAIAAMADCRRRTLELIDEAAVDVERVRPGTINSIGTLLYHIAAIEVDWVYADLLGLDFPDDVIALFPHDVREDGAHLTPLIGESLAEHLARLAASRDLVNGVLGEADDGRIVGPVVFGDGREGTGSWIIHHLLQHEAEHRGQIGDIIATADHRGA